jgi:single-strand DNA-binding protein
MLNQAVLVGRLNETPKYEEGKNSIIMLSVPRSYKNENGEYETDLIKVMISEQMAKNTVEYCKKGDLVGIKGKVVVKDDTMYILGEKLTFLSSRKEEE